jgi:cytochrome P450
MTTSTSGETGRLPTIPVPRDARCPLRPPAAFNGWRESDGLQRASWRGEPVWVISRYQDIRAAMTDPRVSADVHTFNEQPVGEDMPLIFPRMDDPEHNRLRRMMTRDFTARRADAMRPFIQETVDGLLDAMLDQGAPADLVRDFALPLPSRVICELLGVPYEDHQFFEENSAKALDASASPEVQGAAGAALLGYLSELVERKGHDPGDDLLSRLVTDHVASGGLNHATATMNALIMLSAGHETTASMIALGAVALLEHPDAWNRLRDSDDPAVVANVVEELMRYLTVVHSLVDRVALEDLVIGGQHIRAGEIMFINLPAGNWDPDFADRPEQLDIDRNTRGHLGFGYGVHQCLGQNLARAEMQIAFRTLARRMPNLRISVPPAQLEYHNEKEIYGIRELPVAW